MTYLQLFRINKFQGVSLDCMECCIGGVAWMWGGRSSWWRFGFVTVRHLFTFRQTSFHGLQNDLQHTHTYIRFALEKLKIHTHLRITMFIIQMCHERKPFPFHIVTPIPLARNFLTALWTMRLTHVQIHFIRRFKLCVTKTQNKINSGTN